METIDPKILDDEQKKLAERILNLALGRVFATVHDRLDVEKQSEMNRIFESGTNAEKTEFFKKEIPDFTALFQTAMEGLQKDLERAVADQF